MLFILFGNFEWYRKLRQKQWNKKYASWPSGRELAFKYNKPSKKKINTHHWLEYYMSKEQMEKIKIGRL